VVPWWERPLSTSESSFGIGYMARQTPVGFWERSIGGLSLLLGLRRSTPSYGPEQRDPFLTSVPQEHKALTCQLFAFSSDVV